MLINKACYVVMFVDSTVLYQQNNYGSARTDYITDNSLIERAKKRRRLANSVERKVIKLEHGMLKNVTSFIIQH